MGGLGALLTFDFLRILFSLGVFFGEALSGNPAPPQLGKVNRQGLGYKCFNGRGIGWGSLSFTPLQTNKQTKNIKRFLEHRKALMTLQFTPHIKTVAARLPA